MFWVSIIWLVVLTIWLANLQGWISKIGNVLDAYRIQQKKHDESVSTHIYQIKKRLNMIDTDDD